MIYLRLCLQLSVKSSSVLCKSPSLVLLFGRFGFFQPRLFQFPQLSLLQTPRISTPYAKSATIKCALSQRLPPTAIIRKSMYIQRQ